MRRLDDDEFDRRLSLEIIPDAYRRHRALRPLQQNSL
jgi:hypothetical protein